MSIKMKNIASKPRIRGSSISGKIAAGRFIIASLAIFLLIMALPAHCADKERIIIDLEAPAIIIIQPLAGARLVNDRPWIEASVIDADSEIKIDSIFISLDGMDVTGAAIIEMSDIGEADIAKSWLIRYRPPLPLAAGRHFVQIDVADTAGNTNREQWFFFIEAAKPRVDWGVSLTNSLTYSFVPLRRLKDVANLSLNFQPPGHRFTLQLQGSLTDYPGRIIKPNLGNLYVCLDTYAIGWKTKWFDFKHGNISLPFASGLLQFGLGFKGSHLHGTIGQTHQWDAFKGISINSMGMGLTLLDALGGVYRWHNGPSQIQSYALRLKARNGATGAFGFQYDQVFPSGILRSELLYALGEAGGCGVRLQGAAEFASVFWNGDLIYIQATNPVAALTPLPNNDGGAYRYALSCDRAIFSDTKINLGYSQMANNINGQEAQTTENRSWQVGLTGYFKPDFSWQVGYSGGKRESYSTSLQHIFRAGIRQKLAENSWNGNLAISTQSASNTVKYQLSAGYNHPFPAIGLATSASFQLTLDDKEDEERARGLRLRITGNKDWFDNQAHSSLVLEFLNDKQIASPASIYKRNVIRLQGSLDFKVGERNTLRINSKVSSWQIKRPELISGVDFGLDFLWLWRLF